MSKEPSTHPPRRDFQALQAFVRGYLHQDAEAEYGSAMGAAIAFRSDSDAQQLKELRMEWKRFLELHLTLASINQELQRLGAAWRFESLEEVHEMLDVFGI